MPHGLSYSVFTDSIMLRILYDIFVYGVFVCFFIVYLLRIAETINELFVTMYDTIEVGNVWDLFKDMYFERTMDFDDPAVVNALFEDIMSENPSPLGAVLVPLLSKMGEIQEYVEVLSGLFKTMTVFLVFCTLHSFKSFLTPLYLWLTKRSSVFDTTL